MLLLDLVLDKRRHNFCAGPLRSGSKRTVEELREAAQRGVRLSVGIHISCPSNPSRSASTLRQKKHTHAEIPGMAPKFVSSAVSLSHPVVLRLTNPNAQLGTTVQRQALRARNSTSYGLSCHPRRLVRPLSPLEFRDKGVPVGCISLVQVFDALSRQH